MAVTRAEIENRTTSAILITELGFAVGAGVGVREDISSEPFVNIVKAATQLSALAVAGDIKIRDKNDLEVDFSTMANAEAFIIYTWLFQGDAIFDGDVLFTQTVNYNGAVTFSSTVNINGQPVPPTNITNVAPTVNNDSSGGWIVGSHWVNTVTNTLYLSTVDTVGAAVWLAIASTTLSTGVFGADYQYEASLPRETTTSLTFQTKVSLTTPVLTGFYMVKWHAIADTTNSKNGVYRCRNVTDDKNVSGEVVWRSQQNGITEDVTAFEEIEFTGAAKTFEIQYAKATSAAATVGIQEAKIMLFRVK